MMHPKHARKACLQALGQEIIQSGTLECLDPAKPS